MKKNKHLVVLLCLVLCATLLLLAACDSGDTTTEDTPPFEYKVEFALNDGTTTILNEYTQYVKSGDKIIRPETDPEKPGVSFRWWSKTNNGAAYNFDEPMRDSVYRNMYLYAVWTGSAATFSTRLENTASKYVGYTLSHTYKSVSAGNTTTTLYESMGNRQQNEHYYKRSSISGEVSTTVAETWYDSTTKYTTVTYTAGVADGIYGKSIQNSPAISTHSPSSLINHFKNAQIASNGSEYYSISWAVQGQSGKAYYGENETLSKLEYTTTSTSTSGLGNTTTTTNTFIVEFLYDEDEEVNIPDFDANDYNAGTRSVKLVYGENDYRIIFNAESTINRTTLLKGIVEADNIGKTLPMIWLYKNSDLTSSVMLVDISLSAGENVFYVNFN